MGNKHLSTDHSGRAGANERQETVFELLSGSPEPLSKQDIFQALCRKMTRAQVWSAVDILVAKGHIERAGPARCRGPRFRVVGWEEREAG